MNNIFRYMRIYIWRKEIYHKCIEFAWEMYTNKTCMVNISKSNAETSIIGRDVCQQLENLGPLHLNDVSSFMLDKGRRNYSCINLTVAYPKHFGFFGLE